MTRWLEAFRAMDANRRFLAVTIVVALIMGTIAVGWWVRHISYGVLYTRLPAAEAGEIIDQLDQMKVSYRLSEGGSSIMVPSGEVHDLRLRLAAAGYPRGGAVGFEIFDKANLGTTDFLQKINYRRALEGELAKSITTIREVSAARIHIVLPQNRLFAQDQKPATASVILKVNPVGALDQNKVAAITHLVASAVEGLDPERVTILDQNGTLLSSGQEESILGGFTRRQLELQQNVESYLQHKAQTMLDGVLGQGKSIVRVNASLNFEQAEKTIEQYDPDNLAIVSQQQTTETKADKSTDVNGGGTGGKSNVETQLTNYEVSKTVQHIVSAVGTIERLSVSVIVDGTYKKPEGKDAEPVFTPRSQEELDRIKSLVSGTVGIDDQRNDQVQVVSVAFDNSGMEEQRRELDKMEQREFYMDIARKVGYGLAILIGLLIARRIVRKAFKTLKDLVPPIPSHSHPAAVSGIEDEDVQPLATQQRKAKLADQMAQAAKERPDEIARVIKTMMAE